MRKILICECKQEVSTFNPHLSNYDDFGIRFGSELLDYHRHVRNEVGGALNIFDQTPDVEVIPGYSAFFITSGGTLCREAWQRISTEFLRVVAEAQQQHSLDGAYFCMHGAMASEDELDPEGYLISQSRKLLGDDLPLVVSLDLHGILTDRMLSESDAIVAYHTYPHVDFFETGQRAAKLLLKVIDKQVRPVTAKIAIPALVRGDELITYTGRFGKSINIAKQFEQSAAGLSAGMFIGNPFTDVPALQTYSFAVTNDDPEGAATVAKEMAEQFWSDHETMQVPLIPLNELAEHLPPPGSGTVALVDAADATSSGASGDSNAVLKQLMTIGYQGRTLLPIVDALAVERAFQAGIGAEVKTKIGGTLDPSRFTPLEITAKVRLLADGTFHSESFGERWLAGPTAVLEAENFTIVVSTRAVNLYDRSFFFAHGQNPRNFAAVVVKSPHCQPHMYQDWCAAMILIDAPGSSSANLPYLGHQRCPRPIFPLDSNVSFNPQVQIFKRR